MSLGSLKWTTPMARSAQKSSWRNGDQPWFLRL